MVLDQIYTTFLRPDPSPKKTNPEQWQDTVKKELKKIKPNNYENWFNKQNNKEHALFKTSYETQV